MPAFLYDAGPYGLVIFLVATVLLGGAAAFVTGRSMAQTWRQEWHLVGYIALLAAAVRFIHFSIFGEPLLSLKSYLTDYSVLFLLGWIGYRLTRGQQMSVQYGWRDGSRQAANRDL